jgi:phosphoribosylamine--glycine ligase
MNVLLIGSGGREHALAWAISASPLLTKLYCGPGNAGIAEVAECVALDATDHAQVIAFCKAKSIDFVVIGPEAPLVAGLGDDLARAGIKYFGPNKAAAQLEGSKGFKKYPSLSRLMGWRPAKASSSPQRWPTPSGAWTPASRVRSALPALRS